MNKNEIYCEMQKEFVKLTGLKVGMKVKLTRQWVSGEQGYSEDNRIANLSEVGYTYEVRSINNGCIVLNGINAPYFALEIDTTPPKPTQVSLSDRTAVLADDKIVCGCCTLTKKQASEAVKAFETMSKMFGKYSFSIEVEGTTITRENIEDMKEVLS